MKEVTEQDVEHVRELVGGLLEAEEVDDDKAQVLQLTQGDALVRRFIRAASGNHKAAAKRLVRGRRPRAWRRCVCALRSGGMLPCMRVVLPGVNGTLRAAHRSRQLDGA